MNHGRSFAALLSRQRKKDKEREDQSQPGSQAEVDLWKRLLDVSQTSIREFLEAKGLDGKAIFTISTKEVQADGTNLVPLVLWPNQLRLLELIEDAWAEGHAAKMYLPKDREQGTSFAIQAIFAERFLRGGGGEMRTVSHVEAATKGLCDDFDSILRAVPGWVYRDILGAKWKSRKEGGWKLRMRDGVRCVAQTMTCRDGAMGRGFRLRWVHLSEMPWWSRGQKAVKGALTTLRDTPGNIYVSESTGRGYDDFYLGCKAARDGASDWVCFFLSALTHPAKRLPFKDEAEKEEFVKTIGQLEAYGPKDEMRWVAAGATPEQLKWRRVQIAGVCQWDLEFVNQEHPLDFEDVFRIDSDSAFDTAILDSRRRAAEAEWTKEWKRGTLDVIGTSGDVKMEWVESRTGLWWVKKKPELGHSYCFGADPASGKKIVDQGRREADFATIEVRDLRDGEIVAMYRGHTPPETLAVHVLATAKWYGYAKGYVEANNDGKVVLYVLPQLEELWEVPESCLLTQRKIIPTANGRVWEYHPGFWTDQENKPVLVNRLRRWVREMGRWQEGTPAVVPLPLLDEMRMYVAHQAIDPKTGNSSGRIKYEAASGNDDRVSASYLCMEALEWLQTNPLEQTVVDKVGKKLDEETEMFLEEMAEARRGRGGKAPILGSRFSGRMA